MQLATTRDIYSVRSLLQSWNLEVSYHNARYESNHFPKLSEPFLSGDEQHIANIPRSLEWSFDGTSFISVHEDFGMRLFLLDQDMLQKSDELLVPVNRMFKNSPIITHALNPCFSLYNETDAYNNILISQRGVPIQLVDITPGEENTTLSSYKFEDAEHDRLLETSAISFMKQQRQHFICGSVNNVAIFDCARSEPTNVIKIPKTGIISFVSESTSDFLSSGIYLGSYIKNQVTIVDSSSHKVAMSIKLDNGNGINQIIESLNGRYVYPLSRNSTSIPVLDIRMGLEQVATLHDWQSIESENKNQKITGGLLSSSRGLIAGSNKGVVKLWDDAELGLDCHSKTLLKLDIEDNVSCVAMNPIKDEDILGFSTGSRYVEDNNSMISIWDIAKILELI